MSGRIRVFIATSLDGFIAGPGDDLSWLPPPPADGGDFGYTEFISQVGGLLMGRRTYDVVCGFPGPWPYGDLPVLVATRRPLDPKVPTVRAVSGPPAELAALARDAAGGKDVYLDGGETIRAFLEAGLIDEMTVTLCPAVLGSGVPLFAGSPRRHALERVEVKAMTQGLVQLTYRPT